MTHPRAGEFAKKAAHHALNDEELSHLNNIGNGGLLRKVTPPEMSANLIGRGLAIHRVGGLCATPEGHMVLLGSDLTKVSPV